MKVLKIILLISMTIILTERIFAQNYSGDCYDPNYVEITISKQGSEAFGLVSMKRSGYRVKAKYFAAPDEYGNNAYNRYLAWAKNKKIILVSAGTYIDDSYTPVGITIDNGTVVNQTLTDKFDGLVIVYPTGGIAVSNLEDGNLKLNGTNVDPNKNYDIRNSAWDLQTFLQWAAVEKATVFQTHLLAYKDVLKMSSYNSSTNKATRRFLAVGKDGNGTILHVVVNYPYNYTLYQGAKNVLDFLHKILGMEVTFMLNLDTGYQNVFNLYSKDCQIDGTIKGDKPLHTAVNILAYYFE